MTGESYYPGGAQEIPGGDFGWATYSKVMEEIVVTEQDIDDIYQELRHALAEDEAIEFVLELFLSGAPTVASKIKVVTPANSTGGFTQQGFTTGGSYDTNGFGADSFNSFVASLRGGTGGTLLGYDVHTVFGSVKAGNPGLLKFQLQTSASVLKVMPGTILRIRPMSGD